jgi:hypothetical protein
MNFILGKTLAMLVLVGLFTGCASVSVTESTFRPKSGKLTLPPKIFVTPYTYAEDALRVDRGGEKLSTFQEELSSQMADRMVTRLTTFIAPATVVGTDDVKLPEKAWIIKGEFTKINQGSRALRSIIGFGLGGTKMEATTKVYLAGRSGQREMIALIRTSGGSNAQPGALLGGAFGAGPRAVLVAATSGVSSDSRRTARMITAALNEQLAADGAELPNGVIRPKRPKPPKIEETASGD